MVDDLRIISMVLDKHEFKYSKIKEFPKSGQKKVARVHLVDHEPTILKIIDVSPHDTMRKGATYFGDTDAFESTKNLEFEYNVKRVERELNAAKRCSELPQLIILDKYEFIELSDRIFLYYFEEFCPGETLGNSTYYTNECDIANLSHVLLQLLRFIIHFKDNGFVHRDIKPDNIIVNNTNIRVIDAGLAKHDDDTTLTHHIGMFGTLRYAAPEQIDNRTQSYKWDFRTDLYPIGIICVEMFLPQFRREQHFNNETLQEIYNQWLSKDDSQLSTYILKNIVIRFCQEQKFRRGSSPDKIYSDLIKKIGGTL